MTLEEAIIQFKEDAENNRVDLDLEWAEENEQVAKWLEELKDYRDKNKMVVKVDVMNIQELKDKIPEAYEQGKSDMLDSIIRAEKNKYYCDEELCGESKDCSDCMVRYLEQLKEQK